MERDCQTHPEPGEGVTASAASCSIGVYAGMTETVVLRPLLITTQHLVRLDETQAQDVRRRTALACGDFSAKNRENKRKMSRGGKIMGNEDKRQHIYRAKEKKE